MKQNESSLTSLILIPRFVSIFVFPKGLISIDQSAISNSHPSLGDFRAADSDAHPVHGVPDFPWESLH